MVLRIPVVIAAILGTQTSGPSRGEDVVTLSNEVNALARTDLAAAARLAAAGAAREDLDNATRLLLGGLAYANFKLSFEADRTGGNLADLCGLRAVMRLVAPLDTEKEARTLKIAAAEEAEARIERAADKDWRLVCDPAPAQDEKPVDVAVESRPPASQPQPAVVTRPLAPIDRVHRRRTRAGVGTLAPGLLLFAPLAGVLAYRYQGESDLAKLQATVGDHKGTDAQQELAESLNHRYRATTAAAAVLGTVGAALVVTGVVLLATGRERRSRVAVAPWGARGVGGLLFEGRF